MDVDLGMAINRLWIFMRDRIFEDTIFLKRVFNLEKKKNILRTNFYSGILRDALWFQESDRVKSGIPPNIKDDIQTRVSSPKPVPKWE